MKNRKLLLLTLIIILLFSLTACGVFHKRSETGNLSFSVQNGLEKLDNGEYKARLGQKFTLSTNWSNPLLQNANIVWFVRENNGSKKALANQNTKSLTYVFENFTTSSFTFSADIENVEAGSVTVNVDYAILSSVSITSTTDKVVQNTIQQKMVQVSQIEMTADWDEKYLNPNITRTARWFLGNETEPIETGNEFSYLPSGGKESVTNIVVEVSENDKIIKTIIIVEIVDKFVLVEKINITNTDGLIKNSDGIYMQTLSENGNNVSNVRFVINVLPQNGTNLQTNAKWILRNSNGEQVLNNTERFIEFEPKIGKNIITAYVDNIKSNEFVFFVMSESKYELEKDHIKNRFMWRGNLQSHYILDQTDLDRLVNHIVSLHKLSSGNDSSAHKIYLQNASWKNGNSVSATYKAAVGKAIEVCDESGYFEFEYTQNSIYLTENSVFGKPSLTYDTPYKVEQIPILTHYSKFANSRTSLPIDENADSILVQTSNELCRTVGAGIKPAFFNNTEGQKLQALYNKIRSVNFEIIDNTMTEFEKVRAIYDWLIAEIEYDYGVAYSKADTLDKIRYNTFYLEGVFDDKLAVCDGKAKAFEIMCGLENIKGPRITGRIDEGKGDDNPGHAWNKVLLDMNGDNIREWYIVDSTWGDTAKASASDEYEIKEFLTYQYFLLKDDDLQLRYSHQEQEPAISDINVYEFNTVNYDGEEISAYVTSEEQLKKLVKYSHFNENCFIEIKLEIEGGSTMSYLKSIVREANAELGYPMFNRDPKAYIIESSENLYVFRAHLSDD